MEKVSKQEIRERIIEMLGEGAWQYASYNFNIGKLIDDSADVYQLAEVIQDMIAIDLSKASLNDVSKDDNQL